MGLQVPRFLEGSQAFNKGTEEKLFGTSSTLRLLIALIDLDALLL